MTSRPVSRRPLFALSILLAAGAFAISGAQSTSASDEIAAPKPVDLRADGAFGFSQSRAIVLCDTPELRVSALTDGTHLFVQAVLWTDNDDALGALPDGRAIGDSGTLVLATKESGELTPDRDRSYSLNPWPRLPGLHYAIELGDNASTGLRGDSMGRGSIQLVETANGRVRVDTMLIPIAELGLESGATIRAAYWASSPHSRLIVNSVGFEREGQYWSQHLPRSDWHRISLKAIDGVAIDPTLVPEGRGTIEIPATRPRPSIGVAPPEIAAEKWFNWNRDDAPSLASLRGQVVVVEFWATWCGPCIAGIPKLNELNEKYGPQGLVLLSVSDQSAPYIEEWMAKRNEHPAKYVVGAGSGAVRDYGVTGIPAAFVIGRDGKLLWSGHPSTSQFEEAIAQALAVGTDREERD